jgi:hypothetical protein
MKTQALFFTLSVVIILFSPLFGQNPDKLSRRLNNEREIADPKTENTIRTSGAGSFRSSVAIPGTEGAAYLNPDFLPGEIIMENGASIANLSLRYNLFSQQMQYIDGTDTLAIGNPHEIAYIILGDKVFVHTHYLCKNEIRQGYFELLEEGGCCLLKRWYAGFYTKNPEQMDVDECGTFYRNCNCFLQFSNKPAKIVSTKQKRFVSQFGERSESIESLISAEKLKLSKEEDLKKIVAFYNMLF